MLLFCFGSCSYCFVAVFVGLFGVFFCLFVWFGLVWFGLACFVLFCFVLFCFALLCFALLCFALLVCLLLLLFLFVCLFLFVVAVVVVVVVFGCGGGGGGGSLGESSCYQVLLNLPSSSGADHFQVKFLYAVHDVVPTKWYLPWSSLPPIQAVPVPCASCV